MFHGLKSLFHAANVQKIKNVSSVLTHFFSREQIFFQLGHHNDLDTGRRVVLDDLQGVDAFATKLGSRDGRGP